MNIDISKGLLEEAVYKMSPNCDDRPDRDDISGIVIHNISLPPGEFGGGWISDLFLNRLDPDAHPYFKDIAQLKVSAHLLIRRDGEIIQFVPFHLRAWHAGMSSWKGRSCCNDFTVGIELEGSDDCAFESIQYLQLAQVIRALTAAYPKLDSEHITGHEHIAPGRKTDPGPYFDWSHLADLLS